MKKNKILKEENYLNCTNIIENAFCFVICF